MKKVLNKKYSKLIIIQISIIVILTMIFLFVHSPFISLTPNCFWKENFNVSCPSCGSTRCIISLVHGDFFSAFLYNPFLFILIIYLFLLNFLYIINTILNKKYLKFFYPKWWYVIIYFSLWAIYTIIMNII